MLSADEDWGVFTYLIGLIVLVMAGVGLSLLIDKRSEFSNHNSKIQQEIMLAAAELDELTTDYDTLSVQLTRAEPQLRISSQTYHELSTALEIQRNRRADLAQLRGELKATIASLGREFSQIRSDYRRKTRTAAIGENLGNLAVRGGRVYNQATISQVTDVGLEIRHEHGIARLHGPDLDSKLQERFQWNDERRLKCLDEENENRDQNLEKAAPVGATVKLTTDLSSQAAAVFTTAEESPAKTINDGYGKLDAVRKTVAMWRQKVSILRVAKANADSQASNGNRNSVPGSLETWTAKAGRLERELAKARRALELAKAQLAAIAPTDVLLLSEEGN